MQDFVLIDRQDNGVTTLTLNRPEVHNAFDEHMIAELRDALKDIKASNTRVLILRSQGKHFCAGADLNWMGRSATFTEDENVQDALHLAKLLYELKSLPIPTIARVNGAVYGGGVGLVACCDMVVATPNTRFCLSEVKLGLVPAVISPYVLTAMGARQTQRYCLTAEVFDVTKAHQHGLVHEIAEDDALDAQVETWVNSILKNGPKALGAAKCLISEVRQLNATSDIAALQAYTAAAIAKVRKSEEGQEGLTAFLEKRQPNWIKE